MDASADRPTYRAWLRSRWPSRTRALALFAGLGGFVLLAFDLGLARGPLAPGPGAVAALRLSWLVIPVLGWILSRQAPGAPWFPAAVSSIAVLWAWGNAATYLAFGMGGLPIQAVANVLFPLTGAMFLPLTPRGRIGFFTAMWAGCLGVDLAWPQARPLAERLWGGATVLVAIVGVGFVFGRFAAAQRRGLVLRRRLERTVAALESSRARATAAAAEVVRLAAEVAHDVNNPLAAVKANVRVLQEPPHPDEPPGERGEIAADTLEAVDRIAVIVAGLRRKGVADLRR